MYEDIRSKERSGEKLLRHFTNLLLIPRESGNEGAVIKDIIAHAKILGLKYRFQQLGSDVSDRAVGNLVIYVPGTIGHENDQTIGLQGHLDMVCVQRNGVHDFSRDPIPAYLDSENVIRTHGTTLGADNGWAIAAMKAMIEDPTATHGPLELLLTMSEETGLDGALALDPSLVSAKWWLNLDGEEENVLLTGCAGSGNTVLTTSATLIDPETNYVQVQITVSGLQGGHSGLDIGHGRANAIKVLARAILAGYNGKFDERICQIVGGDKLNAIPATAKATVSVHNGEIEEFLVRIREFEGVAQAEYSIEDPGLKITTVFAEVASSSLDIGKSARLLSLLMGLPHGAITMSQQPGMHHLVETSSNLAKIEWGETAGMAMICIGTSTRSFKGSARESVMRSIGLVGDLAGYTSKDSGQYPAWTPNVSSKLVQLAKEVWTECSGHETTTAIHAGLECGVIGDRCPGTDWLSFGPDIKDVHTPNERLSVASLQRTYDFLKALLTKLAVPA